MRYDHESNKFETILNLDELAQRHDLRIVVEPKPAAIVLETENLIKRDESAHKLRKDWLLFRACMTAWAILGLVCIWLVMAATEGSQRNWAFATLTAMITGLVGYLSGRRQSSA